ALVPRWVPDRGECSHTRRSRRPKQGCWYREWRVFPAAAEHQGGCPHRIARASAWNHIRQRGRSAQNVHPEFGLWSNLHRKTGLAVAFIICGSIAAASGVVLQMAGHDANVDGRSVMAAVPLNPGTTLSTIVSPASLAMSAPNSRQGTASPS